jgi:hypothetical protein
MCRTRSRVTGAANGSCAIRPSAGLHWTWLLRLLGILVRNSTACPLGGSVVVELAGNPRPGGMGSPSLSRRGMRYWLPIRGPKSAMRPVKGQKKEAMGRT